MLHWLKTLLVKSAVIAAPLLAGAETAPVRPPNVIVILVDDMGQTDLSCYGSKFYETPHVDQLAKDGVRFANGYSACTVCSPTRAALLTGKYPARLHITDWIAGHDRPKAKLKIPDWQKFLPFEEITLAEQFKSAGYATASIGKWHLTPGLKEGDEAYYPEKHGFDVNIGGYARGQPPSFFAPYKIPTLTEGPAGEFLTDREANEAVKFIETNKDKPFFIYLPHYAVHTPIAGKPEVVAKYQAKAAKQPEVTQKNATYAALVASVDDSLGTIRAALKRFKLEENTLIVFTSDNGGLLGVTNNAPLRVGKGSAYEGGVRVPHIICWPGVTKAGLVEATPAITPDVVRQIGIRSVDPGEKRFVHEVGLEVFDMRYIDEMGMRHTMEQALMGLDDDTHLHVSFDVDFLDPAIAPGVGTTVPGGPTYREAQLCMEMIADTGRLASLDVMELNPALDERNRTALVAVDLIESLFGKSTLMRQRAPRA